MSDSQKLSGITVTLMKKKKKKVANGKYSEYETTSIPLIKSVVRESAETKLSFFHSSGQKLSFIGKADCRLQIFVT